MCCLGLLTKAAAGCAAGQAGKPVSSVVLSRSSFYRLYKTAEQQ